MSSALGMNLMPPTKAFQHGLQPQPSDTSENNSSPAKMASESAASVADQPNSSLNTQSNTVKDTSGKKEPSYISLENERCETYDFF